ncbi:MAG TPA: response regulator [Thermoanaerobaculia bacterium]|nr:response regulator [Thermoanaerobaculia bacterium]
MSRERILIVEDEPNIVLSLEFLLAQHGYEVVVARDGEEALAAVEARPPALVLLDVMLPGIDGYEVCRRLREQPELTHLKIILLTARGRDAERLRGLEQGADLYVTKPFSTRELIATIAGCLGGSPP